METATAERQRERGVTLVMRGVLVCFALAWLGAHAPGLQGDRLLAMFGGAAVGMFLGGALMHADTTERLQ
jgi:hypothetical protein